MVSNVGADSEIRYGAPSCLLVTSHGLEGSLLPTPRYGGVISHFDAFNLFQSLWFTFLVFRMREYPRLHRYWRR